MSRVSAVLVTTCLGFTGALIGIYMATLLEGHAFTVEHFWRAVFWAGGCGFTRWNWFEANT